MKPLLLHPEPLTEETFRPFGSPVRDFLTATPNLKVGRVVRNKMRCFRRGEIEWVSAHYDGEQIIVPQERVMTVFVVAPPSNRPEPKAFRAFLSDGSVGICLSLGVWHALPIPISADHALYENAQGDRWHDHTLEVHLPSEFGTLLILPLSDLP